MKQLDERKQALAKLMRVSSLNIVSVRGNTYLNQADRCLYRVFTDDEGEENAERGRLLYRHDLEERSVTVDGKEYYVYLLTRGEPLDIMEHEDDTKGR